MPRVALEVSKIIPTGIDLDDAVAVGEDGLSFANDGNVYLYLHNPSVGESAKVVVETPLKLDGDLEVDDREYALSEEASILVGPFAKNLYNQDGGTVKIDADGDPGKAVLVLAFK